MSEHDDLPDDVATLKGLVRSGRSEIEHLKLIIAKLQRLQFGPRSEKIEREIEQLELQLRRKLEGGESGQVRTTAAERQAC